MASDARLDAGSRERVAVKVAKAGSLLADWVSRPANPTMWGRLVGLLLLLLIVLAGSTWGAGAASKEAGSPGRPLVLAFMPSENPTKLEPDAQALSTFLSKRSGLSIKAFVASDYAGVVEAMRAGHADLAFLAALPYVLAREYAGAKVLLASKVHGNTFYYSRIFVRKDSGIKRLQDLKGKTIAFTDPVSSSGFLYPLALFIEKGLIAKGADPKTFFKEVYFAGGYEQAIRSLANGFVDAAAVSQYAPEVYLTPEQLQQVTWIAENGPVPTFCVAVGKDLPKESAAKLKAALLELNRPENASLLSKLNASSGLVDVAEAKYDPVLKLAKWVGIVQ